jgi:kinesin family member 3B
MALSSGANSEAVKVAIRCRPLSTKEMANGNECVVNISQARKEIMVSKPGSDEVPKQFTFDSVFDWKNTQAEIYD